MEITFKEYFISDNKKLMDIDSIHSLLSNSYWAKNRSRDQIEKSIIYSHCYGVYFRKKQIGFARVITDYTTMYWLCDVFIDEEHRNLGVGKKLVETITMSDEFKGITGLLVTKDAHELYEQYHFQIDKEIEYMRRNPRKA